MPLVLLLRGETCCATEESDREPNLEYAAARLKDDLCYRGRAIDSDRSMPSVLGDELCCRGEAIGDRFCVGGIETGRYQGGKVFRFTSNQRRKRFVSYRIGGKSVSFYVASEEKAPKAFRFTAIWRRKCFILHRFREESAKSVSFLIASCALICTLIYTKSQRLP